MTRVAGEAFERYINEALEALVEARSIIEGMGLDKFLSDKRARFALRYSIILIVESLADLALAILEKDFGVMPRSYREAFMLLGEKNVVSPTYVRVMERLAALRNMIVHRYWRIDDARIYLEASRGGLDAVEGFIEELRRYARSRDP